MLIRCLPLFRQHSATPICQIIRWLQDGLPTLMLFSKSENCSLCDEMKEHLEPYLPQVNYVEVDINKPENKYWRSRYKYEIPVVHLNGKMIMKHRFDEDVLKIALSQIKNR